MFLNGEFTPDEVKEILATVRRELPPVVDPETEAKINDMQARLDNNAVPIANHKDYLYQDTGEEEAFGHGMDDFFDPSVPPTPRSAIPQTTSAEIDNIRAMDLTLLHGSTPEQQYQHLQSQFAKLAELAQSDPAAFTALTAYDLPDAEYLQGQYAKLMQILSQNPRLYNKQQNNREFRQSLNVFGLEPLPPKQNP
jgi:hypothetical protein